MATKASNIAQAARTIDASGNVDGDTLDSLDSSQFLRSDANDTATGNIKFSNAGTYSAGLQNAKVAIEQANASVQLLLGRSNNVDAAWFTELGTDSNGFHVWPGGYVAAGNGKSTHFDFNGNVGIGTLYPNNQLTIQAGASALTNVNSTITINSPLTTTGATRMIGVRQGNTTQVAHIAYSHDNKLLELIAQDASGGIGFYTGGITRKITMDADGRLLIGHDSVYASNATIEATAINDVSFEANFFNSDVNRLAGKSLQYSVSDSGGTVWTRNLDLSIGTRYSNNLYIKLNNTNQHIFNSSGLVGIGTTSPSAKMHIWAGTSGGSAGSIPADTTAIIESNTNNFLTFLHPPDAGKFSGIVMKDNNIGGYVHHGDGVSGDGMHIKGYGYVDFFTGAGSSTALTAGTKRARINSNGLYLYDSSGANPARIWTEAWPYGTISGYGTGNLIFVDQLYVRSSHVAIDRSWGDYPSITIPNNTEFGSQAEFRFHGHYGVSGGDFSVVVRSDGGYVTGSDARRKINVESITSALDTVLALDGKTFNVVNKDLEIQNDVSIAGKKFGFIAQEIEGIIPEAVKYYENEDTPEENGYASAYSVDYPSIVALLTNAIKEQQVIINDLKTRVETLESK